MANQRLTLKVVQSMGAGQERSDSRRFPESGKKLYKQR